MSTVGINAEWSQELRLPQSLEEYVKAAMLIAIARESGFVAEAPGFAPVVFAMAAVPL